ncbi:MAG TPA: hypothetical protein VMV60_02640 [Thermoanaerobaculia bacterium]|nr:hypothetical protein [Thermoanaerobaculia bacterium]
MLIALAVLAALETASPAPSPVVEVTLTGAAGAPVSAAPRTLSDVARERREGRKAVGGFSAAETTVSRAPVRFPAFAWAEEETTPEPEVVPGPETPEPYVTGWGVWPGGWIGGASRPRPHVSPRAHPTSRPAAGAVRRPAFRSAARMPGFAVGGASRRP